jgi:glycerophosphoryl diester phosphodiesterase
MHPFLDHPGPIVMAHRGGVADAPPQDDGEEIPENSDLAFARSVGLGVRYLESDIRTTADGVPILHHDEDLRRVACFGARVHDLTWREAAAIALPAGAHLMRLDEALITWPGIRWNLDVKDDRSIEASVRVLKRAHALDRVCVASFSRKRLHRLRALLGPEAATSATWAEVGAILRLPAAAHRRFVTQRQQPGRPVAVQVPPAALGLPLLSQRSVAAAHALGVQVHAWTINDPEQMRELLAIGVDALITDHPIAAQAAVRSGHAVGANGSQ